MSKISSPRMQAGDEAGPQVPGGGVRITSPLPEIFTTSSIAAAMVELVPPSQFLLDNFFGNERFFGGRFLTVDTKRQKRVLSPVNSRYHPGTPVLRPVISSTSYDVPKLAPFRNLSLQQLDARAPGQFPNGSDATQYAAQIISDDTQELVSLCQRRTELFAAQILTTGKVRYRLDGGGYEEFGYPNVPTVFTPSIPWDQPNATPITDLKNVRSQIIRDTGMAPDIVVFSDQTADLFTNNEHVLTQLDKLHHIMGQIEPRRPAGTAQWLGRLLLPALEMWCYSEEYIDEFDGKTTLPFIPSNSAICGVTTPSGICFYGSILQLNEDGYEEVFQEKFVPRMMFDLPNETASLRIQSRPCLVPVDCASWTRIDCIPATPKRKLGNGGPAIPAEESQLRRKG
jgi:hypothetical protein